MSDNDGSIPINELIDGDIVERFRTGRGYFLEADAPIVTLDLFVLGRTEPIRFALFKDVADALAAAIADSSGKLDG